MAIYKYPPEVHEFVKAHAAKLRDEDLAEECNQLFGTEFTAQKMKSFRSNHKYYNGKKQWTSEEYWRYQKRYPKGMYEFVRDNSWGVGSKKMAEMTNEKFGTNWTETGMKQFRQRHGIKSGVTGWYRKGRSPGNKGKKQEEYMSLEAIERTKKTRFKPGQSPVNQLPVGSIVVGSIGYKMIKLSMTGNYRERWEFLHKYIWRQHHGEIPKDMLISFKDGNRLNCDIDNLMMLSKGENATMAKKGYRSHNPEITMAGLNVIRLQKKVKDIRKGEKHENR